MPARDHSTFTVELRKVGGPAAEEWAIVEELRHYLGEVWVDETCYTVETVKGETSGIKIAPP